MRKILLMFLAWSTLGYTSYGQTRTLSNLIPPEDYKIAVVDVKLHIITSSFSDTKDFWANEWFMENSNHTIGIEDHVSYVKSSIQEAINEYKKIGICLNIVDGEFYKLGEINIGIITPPNDEESLFSSGPNLPNDDTDYRSEFEKLLDELNISDKHLNIIFHIDKDDNFKFTFNAAALSIASNVCIIEVDRLLKTEETLKESVLIHEIGHCFGLFHTYGAKKDWNIDGVLFEACDDQAQSCNEDLSNCEKLGDYICETPVDPSLKFTSSGASYFSYYDRTICGWSDPSIYSLYNPEFNNYMSAFFDCRTSFNTGQIKRMRLMLNNIDILKKYSYFTNACDCGTVSFGSQVIDGIYTIENQNLLVNRQIVVKRSAELRIINSTIEFKDEAEAPCPNHGILVLPEGKLVIENSTLKHDGFSKNNQWDGIIVYGDPTKAVNLNATTIPHGVVDIKNSTIKNARVAVLSVEGGIVSASNTSFENNEIAVEARDKTDAYIFVRECSFVTNALFPGAPANNMKAFAVFSNAKAIFMGNTFVNNKTDYSEEEDYGTGILSYNSGIRITEVPRTTRRQGQSIVIVNEKPNTFTNLYKGVDFYGGGSLNHNLYAQKNVFTNITKAITCNGGFMHEVAYNQISIAAPRGGGIASLADGYGVYMHNAAKNRVWNNTISGHSGEGGVGIVNRILSIPCFNCQDPVNDGSTGITHKNSVSNTFVATQSEGDNLRTLVLCNDYRTAEGMALRLTNATDFTADSKQLTVGRQGQIGNCKTLQVQLQDLPAGNKFDECLNTIDQVVNLSSSTSILIYRDVIQNNDAPEQNCSTPNKTEIVPCIIGTSPNTCPSLDNPSNSLPERVMIARLNSAQTLEEKEEMRDKLLRLYIHEERIPEAEELIRNETALEIRKIRVAQALNKKDLNVFEQEIVNIPDDGSEETNKFKQLHNELAAIYSSGRSLQQISPTEKQSIEEVANSATESRVIAEGILAQINKEQIIRVPENPQNTTQQRQNYHSQTNNINKYNAGNLFITPNPAQNNVVVRYSFNEENSVKEILLNDIVTGKRLIVFKEDEINGVRSIALENLVNGMYIIHLAENGLIIRSEKVVLSK